MIRDIVVYYHRILRLIPMGHGRETTLSLNFKESSYINTWYKLYLYHGTSWHMVFEFEFCGLSRCVAGGKGGRGEMRKNVGGAERREKRLAYFSWSRIWVAAGSKQVVIVQTTYHVTPDLRWHGQQLPYSSLYVFTEYTLLPSAEFYRTKYCISSWRLYLFPYAYPRTDCCRRGGVLTVQQKRLTP